MNLSLVQGGKSEARVQFLVVSCCQLNETGFVTLEERTDSRTPKVFLLAHLLIVFKRKEKIKDYYLCSSATLMAIVVNSRQKNQSSYCSHKLREISFDSPHL